jgi:FAD synthase|tara:strand:+ start:14453 stop:14791 length:339 start_codon:yes stop_codon:yes gene_type:complete
MDTFEGTVIHGDGYARTIGWPTANLEDISGNLPEKGLYLAHTEIDEIDYFGGLCIDEKNELFLIEFEGSLYGKRLKVDVLKKIKNIDDVDREKHLEDLRAGLKAIDELKSSF